MVAWRREVRLVWVKKRENIRFVIVSVAEEWCEEAWWRNWVGVKGSCGVPKRGVVVVEKRRCGENGVFLAAVAKRRVARKFYIG